MTIKLQNTAQILSMSHAIFTRLKELQMHPLTLENIAEFTILEIFAMQLTLQIAEEEHQETLIQYH